MSGFLKLEFEECEALNTGQVAMLIEILKQSGTVEISKNEFTSKIELEFYKKEKSGE